MKCFHLSSILTFVINYEYKWGFPGGTSGIEPICQCKTYKRHGFDPWVGKIPWRRTWQSTPVFLLGEFHRQRSLAGYWVTKYQTWLKQLSMHVSRQTVLYMQETWVWSLDWEDPLEKVRVTHSSILAWGIPWTEKPGWLQSMGLQRVGQDWATFTFTFS